MPEFCESMMKKEELDEQIFDDDAVFPSIAIFSYEPAPPEGMIWDSLHQDTRSLRTERRERNKWRRQSRRLPGNPYSTAKGG